MLADETVVEAIEKVRGGYLEQSTDMDIASLVSVGSEEDVVRIGAHSTSLRARSRLLNGATFRLIDYAKDRNELEVHKDAIRFVEAECVYYAY